jgi:hypothetical protein
MNMQIIANSSIKTTTHITDWNYFRLLQTSSARFCIPATLPERLPLPPGRQKLPFHRFTRFHEHFSSPAVPLPGPYKITLTLSYAVLLSAFFHSRYTGNKIPCREFFPLAQHYKLFIVKVLHSGTWMVYINMCKKPYKNENSNY